MVWSRSARSKKSIFRGAWIVMILMLVLTGCGKSTKARKLDFQKVIPNIEENYMDAIMVEMTDSDFYEMFELDPSQVVQTYYKFAFLDIRADEIVMIQLKDSALVTPVEEVLWNRVNELRKEFDGYIEKQKEIVDNAIVFHEGNYVFLIVSEHASDIQDYLISSFE